MHQIQLLTKPNDSLTITNDFSTCQVYRQFANKIIFLPRDMLRYRYDYNFFQHTEWPNIACESS